MLTGLRSLLLCLTDARAKVRQLALILVAGTQPLTNLKLRNHIGELTGKEDEKQKWGQCPTEHGCRHAVEHSTAALHSA